MERFLRYIFWVAVTACIAWIARKIFESATQRPVGNSHASYRGDAELPKAKPLFRDPVCGTYVAEDVSYSLPQEGENLHFCSRACMERYQRDLCAGAAQGDKGREHSRVAAGA